MVILGIDPGLNVTGYGIIEAEERRLRAVTAGEICSPKKQSVKIRLAFLNDGLISLITKFHPNCMVLEMVFTHREYVNTAALMAHARGVACLVAQQHGLSLAEYPPARIKKALTGNGNASKEQVAGMVGQQLGGEYASLSTDATDALALAIAHAQMDQQKRLTAGAVG